MPDPSVPPWGMPRCRAFAETAFVSAPFMQPLSSHRTRSRGTPYPFSTAQRAPFIIISSTARDDIFRELFAPTPVGTALKSSSIRSRRPLTSLKERGVVRSLTPQLISKPTPPGEMTPSSRENAATPPMGNPYPQWISGMARAFFMMPGIVATFASCCSAPASRILPSDSERKNRPGTRMPGMNPTGTSHSFSPIRFTPSIICSPAPVLIHQI